MNSWIRSLWYRKGPLAWLIWFFLLPVAGFYSLVVRSISLLYDLGWARTKSLPRPVISVGNLTVGGTGKTPTALWLAEELSRRRYKVGILSRGYKRKGKGIRILNPSPTAVIEDSVESRDAGDEPVMIATLHGRIVGVGPNRYEAGMRLLHQAEVDVFILDDGFQHRRLRRDLDVVLLGADWNGWLIPAGPFREPRSVLSRANVYLVTGAQEKWQAFLRSYSKDDIFFGALRAKDLMTLENNQWKEHPLSILDRKKIVTVSAICSTHSFYEIIREWEGEIVQTLEFPDHHDYSTRDWQRINRVARHADLIVTTEKDMVKLLRFPFSREKLLALRVEMAVEKGGSLIGRVEKVVEAKKAVL